MDKTLLIRACVTGSDALLCLNGMVLCKLISGQEMRLPVHEFIQSGENRIQVILLGSVLNDTRSRVCVELQKDRGADVLVQPQVLYEFEESLLRGERLEKNRLIDVCVDLPVSFPKWRYLDVMQASSDGQDLQKIQDFILQLLRLMQEKKTTLLLPFFSVRNREIAIAYGLDAQQVHHDFQQHLRRITAHGIFPDCVWDSQSWCLLPVRRAAVYALLNNQHQPLFQLQFDDDGTALQIPMHVGVLGGEVFVLR